MKGGIIKMVYGIPEEVRGFNLLYGYFREKTAEFR
jgi:hypothetical protein